jgi:hypothetical protein
LTRKAKKSKEKQRKSKEKQRNHPFLFHKTPLFVFILYFIFYKGLKYKSSLWWMSRTVKNEL